MSALLANYGNIAVLLFTPVIVSVLTPLFIGGITAWHNQVVNKQNAEIDKADFKVKYNKLSIGALIFLIVFMILSSAVFPIYYLCDVPDGPPLEAAIGIACAFGAAAIVCVVLLFAFKRWRIEVSSEKIKFVPFFGKSREYGWEDISRVKRDEMYGRSIYNVYVKQREKKAFSFVSVMVGGQLFAEKLSERGLVSFGKFIHV